ncbi:MAG: hypothetical protein H6978_07545 [Gammaproteobacteria bacterium]|nr:hypothetical protein [Gammaproteobacteria bacterium]
MGFSKYFNQLRGGSEAGTVLAIALASSVARVVAGFQNRIIGLSRSIFFAPVGRHQFEHLRHAGWAEDRKKMVRLIIQKWTPWSSPLDREGRLNADAKEVARAIERRTGRRRLEPQGRAGSYQNRTISRGSRIVGCRRAVRRMDAMRRELRTSMADCQIGRRRYSKLQATTQRHGVDAQKSILISREAVSSRLKVKQQQRTPGFSMRR